MPDLFDLRQRTPFAGPGAGFSVNGRFSFVRDLIRTDTYVSPGSIRYASQTTDSYTGRYGIARSSIQTYDGAVDVAYRGSCGRSSYGASLQAGIFSGTYNMESYAGVGIPSDKMGYISFTKAYDPNATPYAWRYYDRTVSGTLSAHYSYDERYTVAGTAHLDRSSLLAPVKGRLCFTACRRLGTSVGSISCAGPTGSTA